MSNNIHYYRRRLPTCIHVSFSSSKSVKLNTEFGLHSAVLLTRLILIKLSTKRLRLLSVELIERIRGNHLPLSMTPLIPVREMFSVLSDPTLADCHFLPPILYLRVKNFLGLTLSMAGNNILHTCPLVLTQSMIPPISIILYISMFQSSPYDSSDTPSFSPDEIRESILLLPKGKAVGQDSISSEHLIYSANVCAPAISNLFNSILNVGAVPSSFCKSIIIPLYKGQGKLAADPSNYRGISLTPVLSKLFERVLYPHIADSLTPLLHPLQGGFRQGFSSLHTSLILQEGIEECKSTRSKAFIAFLDARKAFDTVWHSGLFFKLSQSGIAPSIWKVLYFWYSHLESAVMWDNSFSQYFPVTQGVRQGAVLSPILYSFFVNDLLFQLESLNGGLFIGSTFVGAPTYVDDVCLISNDPLNLQQMLDIAQSYAVKWHYSFNIDKSLILVIGESSISRQTAQTTRSFYLAGKKLREVDSAKHLGVVISNSTPHLIRASQISSSFRNAFLTLSAIGTRYSQLNPATSLFLVKSFCLPILTFSFCIWSPPQSVIVILERIWLKCLRTLLGLPPHAPTLGVHKLLGTLSINYLFFKSRLCFLMSILCLPSSAIIHHYQIPLI